MTDQTRPALNAKLPGTAPGAIPVLPQPPVSVTDSKAMIIEAATSFDPQLGAQVKAICDDDTRLNIRPVKPGTARMMRVRSHGCDMDPDSPHFVSAERMGQKDWAEWEAWERQTGKPAFTLNHNDADQAQIDFEHDGTVYGTALLAHEIGHALADDQQMASGHGNKNNPKHMQEVQAYTLQHVVMDHMAEHPDPAMRETASQLRRAIDERHRNGVDPDAIATQALAGGHAMTSRGGQYLMAKALKDRMATALIDQRRATMTAIMGGDGPKGIGEVLETAGMRGEASLKKALNNSLGANQNADVIEQAAGDVASWRAKRQPTPQQDRRATPSTLALG